MLLPKQLNKLEMNMISFKFKTLLIKILATCKNREFSEAGIFIIEKFIEDGQISLDEAEDIMNGYKKYKEKITLKGNQDNPANEEFKKSWKYAVYFDKNLKEEKRCVECKDKIPAGGPGCQRRNSDWVHVICIRDDENDNPLFNEFMEDTLKM